MATVRQQVIIFPPYTSFVTERKNSKRGKFLGNTKNKKIGLILKETFN